MGLGSEPAPGCASTTRGWRSTFRPCWGSAGSGRLVALFFVAGLYALVDSFFVRRYLALETPPAAPFLLAGTLAAIAAWKLGQGALSYISLGEGRFEPTDERLPAIDLSRLAVPEYWATYPRGTSAELRSGSCRQCPSVFIEQGPAAGLADCLHSEWRLCTRSRLS